MPETIPQFVRVHWSRKPRPLALPSLEEGYVPSDQVITANLPAVFPGLEVLEAHLFRVLRDAEMTVEHSQAAELLDEIEEGVRRRHFSPVTALVVSERMPPSLIELLASHLNLGPETIHRVSNVVLLSGLLELSRIERPDLHYPRLSPRVPAALSGKDIFAAVRKGDLLLHHPYESFQPTIDFLEQAAHDPEVLAISMSLYRVGRQSPVVDALLDAARRGKQVRVVVEVRARFDEESNVGWARALEQSGAHVVYGMVGLKVHAATR